MENRGYAPQNGNHMIVAGHNQQRGSPQDQPPGCGSVIVERWICPTLNTLTFGALTGGVVLVTVGFETDWRDGLEVGVQIAGWATLIAFFSRHVGGWLAEKFGAIERQPLFDAPSRPRRQLERDPVVHRRGETRGKPGHGSRMRKARSSALALISNRGRKQPAYKHDVPQPNADLAGPEPMVVDFYEKVMVMYEHHHDSLTRAAFDREFVGGQQLYKTYVGPKNQELSCWSDAGIWKRWRIIEQMDGHGKCQFRQDIPLGAILEMNTGLKEYAEGKGWSFYPSPAPPS